MRLPAYWWLLTMAVVQGAFLIRLCATRGDGEALVAMSRPAILVLVLSGLSGLAYGAVQRDPVFVLGQICLLIFYYLLFKRSHDRKK